MLPLGVLTAAEEINAASGRMVSEDLPAKEMSEAERHMSLIQQFTMTRRQFYVKEAQAIRRQRQLRAAAAAYWESALRDFAKADRVKLCLIILQSGVPASLRPQTWVMALGDALKISRAEFEAAQQKAPGLMAGEKEGSPYDFHAFSSATISLRAAAVTSNDSSRANTVRISLAEWRSRLIEDLQKGSAALYADGGDAACLSTVNEGGGAQHFQREFFQSEGHGLGGSGDSFAGIPCRLLQRFGCRHQTSTADFRAPKQRTAGNV
ncbi:hypothetical protein TcCL_NonESM01868 [Trypanosoma cruzi]|nr:hypothetical protein TcCL_NonESM01868 [Trypanosoma cruzi]